MPLFDSLPKPEGAPVDMRELKALEIAARCKITYSSGVWTVPSQSGSGKYAVTLDPGSCTCEDFQLRGAKVEGQPAFACKHVIAARLVRERDGAGTAPVMDTAKVPTRKTYKQNWPVYNLAQYVEKDRVQALLFDLCQGIEEPALPRRGGQRPHLLKDAVFAAAFKVYSTFSSRRFHCDLRDAHAKGYTTKAIPGAKVPAFLENAAQTPILKGLIVRSSLPLKAVEDSFAPDSSGFSTSRFVRWFDEKYGGYRSGHAWVKCHLMCGVKTNIVTAVVIEGPDAGDSPQFKPLVETTAQNFTLKEVSADKAYLSNDNLELVEKLGGTAFIPFKCNSTSGAPGSIWEKMFHYYQYRREEFLPHYHKRSNIESTFSMIKAKFRDHVRSKTDTAMVNEVLCKVLCHNLCCVFMSQCELGIEAEFWPEQQPCEKPADGPDILPLARGS